MEQEQKREGKEREEAVTGDKVLLMKNDKI